MIIKTPACYDISHWKEVANFNAITPRPSLIITKASEGVAFVDDKFVRFMLGMKEAGYHRGAYHFNRKAYDGAGQARHFINVVQSYIDDKTLLILDVEEGGEQASQLWAWFETVRARFPRNKLILYSRRNILEAIPMTAGEKEYFRRIETWIAGYPGNPDDYSTIPNFYIPDPTRFGKPVLWQYSAHGVVSGIVGDVDLNWIDPSLVDYFGVVSEPPTEEPMAYYKVTASELNMRSSGVFVADGSNIVGKLLRDDIVQADDAVNGWRRVRAIYRNNVAVALPASPTGAAWANSAYLVATVFTPPTPTPAVYPVSAVVTMSDGSKWNGTFQREGNNA